MATKPKINKTKAVRDYLKDHPDAMPLEVVAELKKHGVTITPGYAATIRSEIKRGAKGATKKVATSKSAKKPEVVVAPVPVVKPTMNGVSITVSPATINKAQAVRDYLNDHPNAMPLNAVAELKKHGVTVTARYVTKLKSVMKKGTKTVAASKPAKKPEVAVAAVPAEMPTNGGAITLEQVKKVAHTVQVFGGYKRMTEVLDAINELGGVKKFKDLAEAMVVQETKTV